MKKLSKRKKRRIILWVIISILILSGAVYASFKFDLLTTAQKIINTPDFNIPSDWVQYKNTDHNFSFYYPSNWSIATTTAIGDVPGVILGNPMQGTSTYEIFVSIYNNDNKLNSDAYVMQMLSNLKNQDMLALKNGPAPQLSSQYANSSGISLDNNKEYELYNVFEYDHNAEQIFASNKNIIVKFDFPMDEANLNISNPSSNNQIAHKILDTLVFSN